MALREYVISRYLAIAISLLARLGRGRVHGVRRTLSDVRALRACCRTISVARQRVRDHDCRGSPRTDEILNGLVPRLRSDLGRAKLLERLQCGLHHVDLV